MSYYTTLDFIDPVEQGNRRIQEAQKAFIAIEPRDKDKLFLPCNFMGLLAISHYLPKDYTLCKEQQIEAYKQLQSCPDLTAQEILTAARFLDSRTLYSIMQRKGISFEQEERLDPWYATPKNLNSVLQRVKFAAEGGAVNGIWFLTKEDEILLDGGYFNFRSNHLEKDDILKLKNFLSEYNEKEVYYTEDLILELF